MSKIIFAYFLTAKNRSFYRQWNAENNLKDAEHYRTEQCIQTDVIPIKVDALLEAFNELII